MTDQVAAGDSQAGLDAFREEELAGLRLATRGRVVSLVVIAVLLIFVTPRPDLYYYHGLLAAFLLVGLAHYAIARHARARPWHSFLFVAFDFALLGYTLLVPNPFSDVAFPPQMTLRFGNFIYYFILLSAIAFSYRPRVMLWGGFVGGLSWSVGVLWITLRPDTVIDEIGLPEGRNAENVFALFLDPHFVDLGVRLQEVVVFLIVAWLLATIVERSRRLVAHQTAIARERANLARYFPPNIVDQLAHSDEPLGAVRRQPVAVLFADIVGFTHLAEGMPPEQVVSLLREYHRRLERAVFEHGGTLDKFLGDGIMATFGTPVTGPRDAANAVSCARAMLAEIDEWNRDRAGSDQPAVRLSVGIHYGEVVLGDIGSARRLEYAALGDTVNVSSRLEELTRRLDCRVVASEELVRAARAEAAEEAGPILASFHAAPPQLLRGRSEPVKVWTLSAA